MLDQDHPCALTVPLSAIVRTFPPDTRPTSLNFWVLPALSPVALRLQVTEPS
jgi:hypothetical protein